MGLLALCGAVAALSLCVSLSSSFVAPGFYYEKSAKTYIDLKYNNDVGYLPDGTAMNLAGNALNHPETIAPDLHPPGSPLPPPLWGYLNDVGYTPDGTDMTKAGNLGVQR